MASKRDVESKLRELISRLAEADGDVHSSLAETLPEGRVVQVTVPDLDAVYWTRLAAGRMDRLHRGVPERAEIKIRVASDPLVDLVDGRRSLMSSFVNGQVRIEASLSDLARLRRLA